jgi:hypothetical protein
LFGSWNVDFRLLPAIHRLDKLTSGLVILAKSSEIATRYMAQAYHKEYLARVLGEFPLGNEDADGEIIVDQPIACIDRSRGVHAVRAEGGKDAQTAFRRLSFNGHTSVVRCRPRTGRTHQIRVHLQWLGFPIANDRSYGGHSFVSNTCTNTVGEHALMTLPFEPPCTDDAASELVSPLQTRTLQNFRSRIVESARVSVPALPAAAASSAPESASEAAGAETPFPACLPHIASIRRRDSSFDSLCGTCIHGAGWTDACRYPAAIWLHASRYACAEIGADFSVPDPAWARDEFDSRAAMSERVASVSAGMGDADDE